MSDGVFAEVTVVDGRQAVAQRFDVSERTVYRWEKAGMPVLPAGRYDLVQIALWLDKKGDNGAGGAKKQGSKDTEMEGLVRVRRELAELKLRERRGELLELSEVEAMLAPRAMAYRQGIVALQRTLPPKLSQCKSMREMEAVIAQAGRQLLANVLRPLTLASGQILKWEAEASAGEREC
jgi:phage terminase Nu1 subunit (DNA packaging protein)